MKIFVHPPNRKFLFQPPKKGYLYKYFALPYHGHVYPGELIQFYFDENKQTLIAEAVLDHIDPPDGTGHGNLKYWYKFFYRWSSFKDCRIHQLPLFPSF